MTRSVLYDDADRFVLARLGDLNGKLVLDAGSGAGAMAALLAREGATVLAVDVDPDQAGEARSSVGPRGWFVNADAAALPLVSGTMDIVFSRSTSQYMHRRAAYDEWLRVLKPGGTLVLVENLASNPIILAYRLMRQMTWRSAYKAKYVRSIQGYPTWRELDLLRSRFDSSVGEPYYLLRMVSLPGVGHRALRVVDSAIARLDTSLLARMPFMRRFAWIAAVVYTGYRGPAGANARTL